MGPTDFRIFIDLDGVMCDWMGKAVQTFGLSKTSNVVRELLSNNVRGMEDIIDEQHMWRAIDAAGAEWWESLDLFPWSNYLYNVAKEFGEVCFLTQPSINGQSAAGKANWIWRHFQTRKYLLGAPKEMCAGRYSFLIDDSPKKIKMFNEAGGNGIEFPNAVRILNEAAELGTPIARYEFPGKKEVDDIFARLHTRQNTIRQEDDFWRERKVRIS